MLVLVVPPNVINLRFFFQTWSFAPTQSGFDGRIEINRNRSWKCSEIIVDCMFAADCAKFSTMRLRKWKICASNGPTIKVKTRRWNLRIVVETARFVHILFVKLMKQRHFIAKMQKCLVEPIPKGTAAIQNILGVALCPFLKVENSTLT